eukprot:3557801-Karenia_brevis.AAC.1
MAKAANYMPGHHVRGIERHINSIVDNIKHQAYLLITVKVRYSNKPPEEQQLKFDINEDGEFFGDFNQGHAEDNDESQSQNIHGDAGASVHDDLDV